MILRNSGAWPAALAFVAIGLSACAPAIAPVSPTASLSAAPSPTSTLAPTATETPAPTLPPSAEPPKVHDPSTRTDIEAVDRVLDAVLSGDVQETRDVLAFTTTGCTLAEGLGGPPKCREGESEGTPVEVLPSLGPEGSFVRKEEIGEWPGLDISGLYAVYRVSADAYSEESYPAGEYGIILIDASQMFSIVLQVDPAGIVRIDYPLGRDPAEVLTRDAAEVILAPPA